MALWEGGLSLKVEFSTVAPFYNATPSALAKWPYKRGGLSLGDNIVVFYRLYASEIWSDKGRLLYLELHINPKSFCQDLYWPWLYDSWINIYPIGAPSPVRSLILAHYKMYLIQSYVIRPNKKNMCVSDRPTDLKILPPTLTFFMPKKIIDRQNLEIRLRFRVCFRLQQ